MSYPADPAFASLLNELQLQREEMEQQNRELLNIQHRLEESKERFADLYENAPICYLTLDSNGVVQEINLSGASLLDLQRGQIVGKEFSTWVMEQSIDDFLAHLNHVFTNRSRASVELILSCANGKKCDVILESTVDEFNNAVCRSVLVDVTNSKYQEHIYYLAHYDMLTGLPNRILFQDRFSQALAAAERKGEMVALLFLDLDRFKSINDSLGHAVGDELLKSVAKRLERCTRKVDTVARLAGDEFVIVLAGIVNLDFISIVAGNIIALINAPFQIEGHAFSISTSVGASVYPNDGHDIQTLLRNADSAMYHAKKMGRSNFQFYTRELNARALESLVMANNLRDALGNKCFELHYQPQIEIESGKIIGLEALLHWSHPELGFAAPDGFIPEAEDRGLIVDIFNLVLREAANQINKWQKMALPTVPVAINISAMQIRRHGLINCISQILQETGLDPGNFEFEVMERDMMHEADATMPMAHELKNMGVRLSIGNFGTGYSSLSCLRSFPISKLKIGHSFVADLPGNADSAAIVNAIIGLAKSLKFRVIAEGVETLEQWQFLKSNGCDEIQGHYFSEALDADSTTSLLLENKAIA